MLFKIYFSVFYVICSNFGVQGLPVSEKFVNKKIELSEKILVPKKLKVGDEIVIIGQMVERTNWLQFGLEAGNKNRDKDIVCQYEADFDKNTMYLIQVTKGNIKEDLYVNASDILVDKQINITFRIESEYSIGLNIFETAMTTSCQIEPGAIDQIHSIIIQGVPLKVDMVIFKFV